MSSSLPRIVILDVPDNMTTSVETQTETKDKDKDMEEENSDDEYKVVGSSLAIAIGDSIDVTRSEKSYADLLKSVREECEQGLSVPLLTSADDDECVWEYILKPQDAVLTTITKKCAGIANITILFRGRADDGILTVVDSAYLTFNDRVIDIASMAPNQDDRRVATFRGFSESMPFMFSCMSATDELKIFIRFKKHHTFKKEMVRILADLFHFESQDDFLHQSWILPLKFDEGQEFFYDCSSSFPVLSIRGGLSAPPDVLARRASRGWPHAMEDVESSESSSSDDNDNSSDTSSCSKSKAEKNNKLKDNGHERGREHEERLRAEWKKRMEFEARTQEARERAKRSINSMAHELHRRGRAYSDEDVMHIERLLHMSQGMSPEAEALCAIEIARWKAQKKLLEDDLVKLNSDQTAQSACVMFGGGLLGSGVGNAHDSENDKGAAAVNEN